MTRRHWLILWGTALALLAVRVWWVRPVELISDPILSKATIRGGDYTFTPRPGVATATLVRTAYLEDYDPHQDSAFGNSLEGRPSRYVRDGDYHHYVEYAGRATRIQVHSALGDDGIDHWLEFAPSNLAVDAFFVPEVAILLDSERPKYKVYIPNRTDQTYMTVSVAGGRVVHVYYSKHVF